MPNVWTFFCDNLTNCHKKKHVTYVYKINIYNNNIRSNINKYFSK